MPQMSYPQKFTPLSFRKLTNRALKPVRFVMRQSMHGTSGLRRSCDDPTFRNFAQNPGNTREEGANCQQQGAATHGRGAGSVLR